MLKIDVFNHIFPKKFFDKMVEILPTHKDIGKRVRNIPFLIDLDLRFKVLEEFGDDYWQILSLASPLIEALGGPDVTGNVSSLILQYQNGKVELVWPKEFATANFVYPAPPFGER